MAEPQTQVDPHQVAACALLRRWGIDPEFVAYTGLHPGGYRAYVTIDGVRQWNFEGAHWRYRETEWPEGFPVYEFLYYIVVWKGGHGAD